MNAPAPAPGRVAAPPAPASGRTECPRLAAVSDYYGQRQGTTYLQIFSEPAGAGERVVHRELRDQDAYDTWHLSLYFKEVLAYRRLLREHELTLDDLPRKEKNLLVYLMLAARPAFRSVLELGSSLFELIDGLEVVQRYFAGTPGGPRVDPRQLCYTGVEISALLAQASIELHPGYGVTILPDFSRLDRRHDLIYDRNVTSYAFTTAGELAAFINHGQAALMNLFVSTGETFTSARLGKALTYFSLRETIQRLDRPLYHLFGFKAPGPHAGRDLAMGRPVVEGFFLCADEGFAADFMRLVEADAEIARYFRQKGIALTHARELLT